MPIEFEGYWSERDKEIWNRTDWKARNYEDVPVEDDVIDGTAYIYGLDKEVKINLKFQKYIRSNPIYSPYYGPVYTPEFRKYKNENHLCSPCYDGRKEGPYQIHDRFESSQLADALSR